MIRVIVPLTLILAAFAAYCIWQYRQAVEAQRRADRDREREREEWSRKMMGEDP